MVTAIDNPYAKVFNRLREGVKEIIGENFSMDDSTTPSKFPYIQLQYLGGVQVSGALGGDECATDPTFQIDCYATGYQANDKVWAIDDACHKVMKGMGFSRGYHSPNNNADPSIKRVTSRYSRTYTGQLLGEGKT